MNNPDTGKRVSRMNPSSEWMTRAVPALRIVSDELWTTAKARQEQTRHAVKSAGHLGRARRPQYLFSGLTKCGVCGAGFIMAGRNRLACFGARDQGRCDNLLTIRRNEVEARVLKALHEKLLRQDLFEEFCDEFTRDMNRLRMEHRASLSAAEREIERIEVRRKKLIEMAMEGVPPSEGRTSERPTLPGGSNWKPSSPPRASRARCFIRKLPGFTARRSQSSPERFRSERRSEATEALRALVDLIVLMPDERGDVLQIELRGNLAAMLGVTVQTKRSSESNDLSMQVSLVAGAGFDRPHVAPCL